MTDLIKQIVDLNLRCDSSTLLPIILQVEQLIKERDEATEKLTRIRGEIEAVRDNLEDEDHVLLFVLTIIDEKTP